MKQNICELDTMIFFREALEAHEFMLLPVMACPLLLYSLSYCKSTPKISTWSKKRRTSQ